MAGVGTCNGIKVVFHRYSTGITEDTVNYRVRLSKRASFRQIPIFISFKIQKWLKFSKPTILENNWLWFKLSNYLQKKAKVGKQLGLMDFLGVQEGMGKIQP